MVVLISKAIVGGTLLHEFKTIKTIAQAALPVDERLMIRRCRYAHDADEGAKRLCIVTGTHGDELAGQYVCFALARRLQAQPEALHGVVDLYPALNPLGIDTVTRGVPAFDLDMNRLFPGTHDGSAHEQIAAEIVADLQGADLVLDVHASNIFLREVLQARIQREDVERLVPIARLLNLDFVWAYPAATVLQSTLSYSLNERHTPCLSIEMDVGMRINTAVGDRLVEGVLNAMAHMGMWTGPVQPVSEPVCALEEEKDVVFLNAEASGIYVADPIEGDRVRAGQRIGRILDPLEGEVLSEICAPCDALVFTMRAYPVVYQGSLIARLCKEVRA